MYQIFTARKRNLGEGNVFTAVCHSVHRGAGGGGSAQPPDAEPLDADTVNKRAVRILLKCILVLLYIDKVCKKMFSRTLYFFEYLRYTRTFLYILPAFETVLVYFSVYFVSACAFAFLFKTWY